MKNTEQITKWITWIIILIIFLKPSFLIDLIIFLLFLLPIVLIIYASYKRNNLNLKFSGFKDGKQYFTPNDPLNIFKNINCKTMPNINKNSGVMILLVLLAIIIIPKMIVIIPAGETGVYHLFGKVSENELSSGLHFVNPLANVTKMTVRTEQYTMSIAREEGQNTGDDSIDALTNEGLTVKLDITVFYHLLESRASDVFKDLGADYEEKIIRPEIRSAIREVVANYDSKSIYSDKRDEMITSIKDKLASNIDPRGIIVEQILLRNVILPVKLDQSIQEKLQAEQESQRYNFVLDKEKKEADRKRIEAEGIRDAQKTISESLTPEYINYLYIKELKDRQGTIYVPTNPDNGLPLFKGVQ
ncbi:MAG: prohibitin family protein [Candidatus Paceibacterota bacterium]|jgi:regulator of protease activity HflC (stomatin/prohibitin superfamily)